MKNFILLLPFLLIPFHLFAFESPTPECQNHVVVIGGGPAGLATAIEARKAGFRVQVIEKRSEYTRPQVVFLNENSIQLLKNWGADLQQVKLIEIAPQKSKGIVELRILEELLAKRTKELNIEILRATFDGFNSDQSLVVTTDSGAQRTLPYDFVVGADGAHSKTREALGISVTHFGDAKALATFVRVPPSTKPGFDVSPALRGPSYYLKRIKIVAGSVIFMQSYNDISEQEFRDAVANAGWHEEAEMLAEQLGRLKVDVTLQQALVFSAKAKAAILVGDASATASFFNGMGANTAFKTAEAAGLFFQTVQEQGAAAYETFDLSLKLATDAMIQDSQFLFDYSN